MHVKEGETEFLWKALLLHYITHIQCINKLLYTVAETVFSRILDCTCQVYIVWVADRFARAENAGMGMHIENGTRGEKNLVF